LAGKFVIYNQALTAEPLGSRFFAAVYELTAGRPFFAFPITSPLLDVKVASNKVFHPAILV
jgi:hypothetical protein